MNSMKRECPFTEGFDLKRRSASPLLMACRLSLSGEGRGGGEKEVLGEVGEETKSARVVV